jgi:hypothetical protein
MFTVISPTGFEPVLSAFAGLRLFRWTTGRKFSILVRPTDILYLSVETYRNTKMKKRTAFKIAWRVGQAVFTHAQELVVTYQF